MEQDDASRADHRGELPPWSRRASRNRRRWRRVPPAITPVRLADIAAGIAGQRAGTGRDEFRTEFTSFLDAESAASYTSYRRALCACLLELSSRTDDGRSEVYVPAFCSSDFADAIEGAGLTVSRYDVDPETMALDPASLEGLPTETALAVVVVNVLGYGSPMDRVTEYCRENDIYLVEALGYSIGSEYGSERLGTFGDCSVVNFQQGKPIPVGGGMVVSQDADLEFSDEGRPAVAPNLDTLTGYAVFGHPRPYFLYSRIADWFDRIDVSTARYSTHPESKFDVSYAPPFATISNFQGTVARRLFGRLETHRRRREHTAAVYATELADCPHVRHVRPVSGLSNHQHVRYPLLIDAPDLRDELREALSGVGVEAVALYDWPPIDDAAFPGAARLQRGIITLPTHPYVDEADRRLIVRTVRDVLR
ncbi:DegT/DnrJ/EryC1/StrS family aminotransferase [Halopenitus persicus]|uniref:DegT/DnrJ/EryC1/StrS family aminotransferase n=1 Tax=Halopenitus persicus TaxID=1048396 RepID=UPI000BBB6323|nr:DegT/DnrJ/EryC1/StrS family aminotransferase [Halopenitus persicus]